MKARDTHVILRKLPIHSRDHVGGGAPGRSGGMGALLLFLTWMVGCSMLPEYSRVFSFRAQDMPLADALRLFSRVNKFNIIVEPDSDAGVTSRTSPAWTI